MSKLPITEEILFLDVNDLLDELYARIGEHVTQRLNQFDIPDSLTIKYIDYILKYAPEINIEKIITTISQFPALKHICEKYNPDYNKILLHEVINSDINIIVYLINKGINYKTVSYEMIVIYIIAGAGRIIEDPEYKNHPESLPYYQRFASIKNILNCDLNMIDDIINIIVEYLPYELLDVPVEKIHKLEIEHKRLVGEI